MSPRQGALLCLLFATLGACYGPTWPSRGLVVSTASAGASVFEVKETAEELLIAQNFADIGKGGRDEIKNQRTVFNFEGPNDIIVVIAIDRVDVVPIRVSQNRTTFSPEASQLYEALASSLERRWPGAITREQTSTK